MIKILFICTGNTCRSIMAEGIFKKIIEKEALEDKFSASSAGIAAFAPMSATKNAVLALEEMGIDISQHKSRLVTKELLEEADLALTMTRSHRDFILKSIAESQGKVFTLAEYVEDGKHRDILDPFGSNLEEYKRCRDQIEDLVKNIIKKF